MDKSRLTKIFNRGFRQGANDRAGQGLAPSPGRQPPSEIPDSPEDGDVPEQIAWSLGYATGYQIGASDTELAHAEVSGAHCMMSGVSEQMLERVGVFRKMTEDG